MCTETLEASAFLSGLFTHFEAQRCSYNDLIVDLRRVEARIELEEKTLALTREHLQMAMADTEGTVIPLIWRDALKSVRFVGVRLADACVAVLQERKRLTQEELTDELNRGNFRFRTNSPFREIHAALLKNPQIERDGQTYIWTAPREKQITMRLRTVAMVSKPNGEKPMEDARKEIKPN